MISIELKGNRSIDELLELLEREPLHPASAEYARVMAERSGCVRFAGDFVRLSCPFEVVTDDSVLMKKFFKAIDKNTRLPEYREAARAYFER